MLAARLVWALQADHQVCANGVGGGGTLCVDDYGWSDGQGLHTDAISGSFEPTCQVPQQVCLR